MPECPKCLKETPCTTCCPRCFKGQLITDSQAFTGVSCLACGFEPRPEGWIAPAWSPDVAFRAYKGVNMKVFDL